MKTAVVRQSVMVVLSLLATSLSGQQKARFSSVRDALRGGAGMNGGFGPRGLTWIDGGRRYSYIEGARDAEEIRAFDPATGQDTWSSARRG